MSVLLRTGDVDPITYGGGVVKSTEYGIRFFFWDTSDEEVENEIFSVSVVDVPEDVFEEYDWVDIEGFSRFLGVSVEEIRECGKGDLASRVWVLEELSSYTTLDNEPMKLDEAQLIELCEFELYGGKTKAELVEMYSSLGMSEEEVLAALEELEG